MLLFGTMKITFYPYDGDNFIKNLITIEFKEETPDKITRKIIRVNAKTLKKLRNKPREVIERYFKMAYHSAKWIWEEETIEAVERRNP